MSTKTNKNGHDAPPSTLGPAELALWRGILHEYAITDLCGLTMLRQICEAADRIAECQQLVKRDGAMLQTNHGPKENPLLKIEATNRSFIVKTLRVLGLNNEPKRPVGRPPSPLGIDYEQLRRLGNA